MTALHFAFFLALTTQVAKAGDLLLRPGQQRWLQDRLETLALALSELSTSGLRRWSGYEGGVDILWKIALFGAFIAQPVLVAQDVLDGLPTWKVVFGGIVGPSTLISLLVLRRKYGAHLRAWMFAEGFTATAVARTAFGPFLFVICGYVSEYSRVCLERGTVIPADVMIEMLKYPTLVWATLACTILLALASPLLIAAYLLLNLTAFHSIVMLVVRAGSWMLAAALAFVRGLVWRIVEYNKGAWSAITLIVSVGLGVAELIVSAE